MVRIITLTFAIGFLHSTNAQSLWKLNHQLNRECKELLSKYDELSGIQQQREREISLTLVDLKAREKYVQTLAGNYLGIWMELNDQFSKLKQLGVDTVGSIHAGTIDSLNIQGIEQELQDQLNRTYGRYIFGSEVEAKPDLRGLTASARYNVMRAYCNRLIMYVDRVQSDLNDVALRAMTMSNVAALLNDLTNVIQQNESKANQVLAKVDAKVSMIRKDFKNQGPEGFDSIYFMVFPDLFPEVTQRYLDENRKKTLAVSETERSFRNTEAIIYEVVEEDPAFPGGSAALKTYIAEHFVAPNGQKNKEVVVGFNVFEDGSLHDIQVIFDIENCPECSTRAVRLVEGMPRWIPAKINRKPQKMAYVLAVPVGKSSD